MEVWSSMDKLSEAHRKRLKLKSYSIAHHCQLSNEVKNAIGLAGMSQQHITATSNHWALTGDAVSDRLTLPVLI